MATTEQSPVPDWIHPGAEVAEYTCGRGLPSDARVDLAVVAKVGKRDIVLTNGNRYNVNHLSRSVGGTWGITWDLRPRGDRDVTRVLCRVRRRLAVSKVKKALEGWEETGSLSDLRDAIAALSAHLPAETDR